MKAIINELWETGRRVITTEPRPGEDFAEQEINCIADLRGCENVIVEKREKGEPFNYIMLDDDLYAVAFRTVTHPADCSSMRICEIS